MTDIPWLGPVVVIVLAAFVVSINLGLVSLLRNKDHSKKQNILNDLQKSVRNPWDEENKQFKKLSDEVAHLIEDRKSQNGDIKS